MKKLQATIKIPGGRTEEYLNLLYQQGIEEIEVEAVPYDQFVEESRLNYDCVFPEMWEDHQDVSYLRFYFEDSGKGRSESFNVEYNLMQIPLNLCYVDL